jgi:hypothetical protein
VTRGPGSAEPLPVTRAGCQAGPCGPVGPPATQSRPASGRRAAEQAAQRPGAGPAAGAGLVARFKLAGVSPTGAAGLPLSLRLGVPGRPVTVSLQVARPGGGPVRSGPLSDWHPPRHNADDSIQLASERQRPGLSTTVTPGRYSK